jgi:hypothetical protein
LINDIHTHFREPVDVAFPGTVVSAFDGIVKQAVNAIAVILIILGRINSTLCRNAVRAARAVLKAERLYVISKLAQRCGGGGPCQTRSHYNDFVFTLVGRIDQLQVKLVPGPFFRQGAFRNF